jgi:hypothetical protein
MVLLVFGIVSMGQRFDALHPGWNAVNRYREVCSASLGIGAHEGDTSARRLEIVDPDIELGQARFWKHCKQVLEPTPGGQQVTTWPVNVQDASDELVGLLSKQQQQGSGSDVQHSSSQDSSTSRDKGAAA